MVERLRRDRGERERRVTDLAKRVIPIGERDAVAKTEQRAGEALRS